ncbi:hypothetical protein COO60DRAFT_1461349 [Scenedesmus sp. NREL 46B-D3]|nr:hypothetical protein COO60DRAFT_1461349 [Scenedesmus sp. NREL 46B-D3]
MHPFSLGGGQGSRATYVFRGPGMLQASAQPKALARAPATPWPALLQQLLQRPGPRAPAAAPARPWPEHLQGGSSLTPQRCQARCSPSAASSGASQCSWTSSSAREIRGRSYNTQFLHSALANSAHKGRLEMQRMGSSDAAEASITLQQDSSASGVCTGHVAGRGRAPPVLQLGDRLSSLLRCPQLLRDLAVQLPMHANEGAGQADANTGCTRTGSRDVALPTAFGRVLRGREHVLLRGGTLPCPLRLGACCVAVSMCCCVVCHVRQY